MYLQNGFDAGMMTAPTRGQSLPVSPFVPPSYTSPTAQLASLRANPFEEARSMWIDWWTHWVEAGYSDWNQSIDAIRQKFNDWIDDPEVAFPGETDFNKQRAVLVEKYGDCYTSWYVYPWTAAGPGCVHTEQVENVFRCYNNLLHKGFPELYYTNTTPDQREALYRTVADCSGVDYQIVWPLLNIAKRTFETGGKVHLSVMYPVSWEHHKENRTSPLEEDTATNFFKRAAAEASEFFTDLASFLKWAVIVGGIAFAGYYGYMIFIESRSNR